MTDPSPPEFDFSARDRYYWESLQGIIDERGYTTEDILRHWPAYALRRDTIIFLAHYELFKHVIDLPGCIIELGVFRGASFFSWSVFLETFCPFDRHRKVYGFDTFEGLGRFTTKDGADEEGRIETDESVGRFEGSFESTAKEAQTLVEMHNADGMFPGMERSKVIVGDILETLPTFVEENPGLAISLLHFDVDLYEPTRKALELLYPKVVPGGVVVFDEYGLLAWPGETNAVNEYFATLPEAPVIRKLPWAQTPHGYVIK